MEVIEVIMPTCEVRRTMLYDAEPALVARRTSYTGEHCRYLTRLGQLEHNPRVDSVVAGQIPGVVVRHLKRNDDARGWLAEVYREDELPQDFTPAMGYISVTHPGVARGPHAH